MSGLLRPCSQLLTVDTETCSFSARSCPHCGYVLTDDVKRTSVTETISDQNKKQAISKLKDVMYTIIHLEWLDDIADFLEGIPLIGPLLRIVFIFVAIILSMAAIVFMVAGLFTLSPILGSIILLVGMNIISYFASYKWEARQPWFFWVCLGLSLFVFVFMMTAFISRLIL